MTSSKSTISLSKTEDSLTLEEQHSKESNVVRKKDSDSDICIERNKSVPNIPEKIDKQDSEKERAKSEGPLKSVEKQSVLSNGPVPNTSQ